MDSWKGAESLQTQATPQVPAFLHHLRVLIALIPCWLMILSMSGRIMLSTFGFFAAVASFLYSVRLYNSSLLALVAGITACNVLQLLIGTSFISTSSLFGFMLLNNTFVMGLSGAYCALLFPYIYSDAKTGISTARTTEKFLFVVMPLLATSMLTWAAISQFGIQNGPYWMLMIQMVSYILFGLPQQSSFSKFFEDEDSKAAVATETSHRESEMIGGIKYSELVCDELLSYFQTIQLFLPAGLHVAIYWRVLFVVLPSTIAEWTHFTDIVILILVPLLLLGLLGTVGRYSPLWWMRGKVENVYKLFLMASTLLLIPCLEFRVLYFAFDHLFTGLERPYNYIAITLALYAFLLAITLHLRTGNAPPHSTQIGGSNQFQALVATQMLKERKVSYALGLFCALLLSKALGIPMFLWPATLFASVAFISFYFERRFWMYAVFVGCVVVSLSWFVARSLYPLNITFFTLAGYLQIRTVCALIIVMATAAAWLTGLMIVRKDSILAPFFLIAHAALLALLEEVFHMEQLPNGTEIYPAYLVVLTTTCGVLMARKLKNMGHINTNVVFVVSMIYISKLALLLKPVSWPTISAMLLLSPPLYLIFKLWDAQHALIEPSKSNTITTIYVAWLFVASMFNRWTLFQRLLELLAGEIRDHASPALVHGISFVFFGALLPPLAWYHPFRSEHTLGNDFSTRRRRIISFAGFTFIAFGFAAMASQQMFGKAPSQQVLGSGVMSSLFGTRAGLPYISTLALLALLLIVALIFTETIDVVHSARQRVTTSMAIGLATGAFISPFALSTSILGVHASPEDPSPVFVTLGICLIFQLAALIIAFSDWHTIGEKAKCARLAPKMAPAAYVLMWLLWPLLFLSVVLLSVISGVWRKDELESYNVALIAIQAFAQGLVALVLKVLSPNDDFNSFGYQHENHPPPSSSSSIPKKFQSSSISDIANLATLGCFALATVVHFVLGGSDSGFLLLAPILLLLQRSGTFQKFMPRNSPYFFVYLAAAASLVLAAQAKLWMHGPLSMIGDLFSLSLPDNGESEITSWIMMAAEVAAHLAVLPSIASVALFLWDFVPVNPVFLTTFALLALGASFITDTNAVAILGLLNAICTLAITAYSWVLATPEQSRP
jgi:hypothetical protein